MTTNLLPDSWSHLDTGELRILLDERIGGPGQYDDRTTNPDTLYLPLGGDSCRVALRFRNGRIAVITPGPAFDAGEWERVAAEVEGSLLVGPRKVGRDISFSSFRVSGSWQGAQSGVQILPPPENAPRAPFELAEHPFILEFPIQGCDRWRITNHRRMREHRKLTLLFNVLLTGRTNLQPRRTERFWAEVGLDGPSDIRFVQPFYFADFGEAVADTLSPPAANRLPEVDPDEYYTRLGHVGQDLRVPANFDASICRYLDLSPDRRAKFDRAMFWLDMASREWAVSVSSSFAALVSAVESLTDRGVAHRAYCDQCQGYCQHEVPGATERFRAFFEQYAPGTGLRKRRNAMYALRSGILHGSTLMQLDQDLAFGWDPPYWDERELHEELWGLVRVALRNWLVALPTPSH